MKIRLTNPWTGALVDLDISDLSAHQFDRWVALMDDDVCEQIHKEMAPCTPAEFVAAYVDRVGPDAAGRIILGS
jgi:hypothetical protein